jgi:hypothetical protein
MDTLSENLLIVGGVRGRIFDFVDQVIKYDDLCLHQKMDFSYFTDKWKAKALEIADSPKPLLSFALDMIVSPSKAAIPDYGEVIMQFYANRLFPASLLRAVASMYQCIVYRNGIGWFQGERVQAIFQVRPDPDCPGCVRVDRDSVTGITVQPGFKPDVYHLRVKG